MSIDALPDLLPTRAERHRVDHGPVAPGAVALVPLTGAHARWVADLQVTDLAHGLFPRLGRRFVRAWHAAHMASPYAVGLVAHRDGVLLGFALGSSDRRAHVAWILEHRRGPLLRAAVPALLLRPHVLVHFLATRGRRYARRLLPGGLFPGRPSGGATGTTGSPAAATGSAATGSAATAVLEAIVVLGSSRRAGVGTTLLSAFVATVGARGAARVELVTKAGAEGAAGFYDRRGWERTNSHLDRDGDVVHTYRRDLAAPAPAAPAPAAPATAAPAPAAPAPAAPAPAGAGPDGRAA